MTLLHVRLSLDKMQNDHPELKEEITNVITLLVDAGKAMTSSLKLSVTEDDFNKMWYISDANYDDAPDAGAQLTGAGGSKLDALVDYFNCEDVDFDRNYIIPGDFFK